ncbi:type VI secretion system contractile sheath small subunit [Candidatus Poribacteria bacterium]
MLNVPKSRVTIDYVDTTGGATEKKELPQRLLVVGDYTMKPPDPDNLLAEREKVEINQRNFDDVLRNQDLSLDLTVPNKLSSEEGDEMTVNLKFDSMNSFRPEAVASQVEELKTIMEVRNLLLSLRSHVVSRRQFRRELERIVNSDLDSAMEQFSSLGFMPDESEDGGEAEAE